MSLKDDVQAVRTNNALSEDEKRAAIYQIKVNALFNEVMSGATDQNGKFLGKSFTYNGVDIVCHAVGVTVDPLQPKRLVLDLSLTKNGVTRRDTYYITNPPVVASDGTENLLKVVGEMISSWATW